MSIGVPNQVKDLYAQLKAKGEEKKQKLSYNRLLLLAEIAELIHLLERFAQQEDYCDIVESEYCVKHYVSVADNVRRYILVKNERN